MVDMLSRLDTLKLSAERKTYIKEQVVPVLQKVLPAVLANTPTDTNAFLLTVLREKLRESGDKTKLTAGLAEMEAENVVLRKQLLDMHDRERAAALMQVSKQPDAAAEADAASEDEVSDDELDEIPESAMKPASQMGKTRCSVSAEAYGEWNKKTAFQAPQFPKSDEVRERLKLILGRSFLFSSLDEKDMSVILNAVEEKRANSGEKLIAQGDSGDFMFIVEEGRLDCYKTIDEKEVLVKTCEAGDVFGELALLYNAPRAASVFSREVAVLWRLDRETFNHIVKEAASKKRNKYTEFLSTIPLLSSMNDYEKSQIADALKPRTFAAGEDIVKEGDNGDLFFLIQEGTAKALKKQENGDQKTVMNYQTGDYFGELALLHNAPRAATVQASGFCRCLSLDRRAFKRLLGPLDDILKRGQDKYG